MNEAIIAGAVAGAIAGAIAGAAVMVASHGIPFGPFGRRRGERVYTFGRHPAAPGRWQGASSPMSARGAPRIEHRGGFIGPFDRFNDRAKRVLALAQDEAIRFNHNYIGTEHILLGLVREGEGVAAQALIALGIDLGKVRSAAEFIIGRGEATTSPSEITLSPRTKKVIELAIDEARKLGHSHVGTEHLLLGLVREGEGIASGIIESLGVTLDALRTKVMEILGSPHGIPHLSTPTVPKGPFDLVDSASKRVLGLAQDEAQRFNHNWIGTEHLLLGLLREDESVAAKALASLGVTLDPARAAVEKAIPRGDKSASELTLTPRMMDILTRASLLRPFRKQPAVTPELLLLALVSDETGVGTQVLTQLGATPDKVREAVDRLSPPKT